VQGSTPTYYLSDGLGSTTELANGGGTVTGTYTYDAFGAVRAHTGATVALYRATRVPPVTTPAARRGSTSWPAGRRPGPG